MHVALWSVSWEKYWNDNCCNNKRGKRADWSVVTSLRKIYHARIATSLRLFYFYSSIVCKTRSLTLATQKQLC